MCPVSVRYVVYDIEAAIDFYRDRLGFSLASRRNGGNVELSRDGLRLLLSVTRDPCEPVLPPLSEGRIPVPGGWNRIQIEVDDIESKARELRDAGVHFRSGFLGSPEGIQVLIDDPYGNLIELIEPPRPTASENSVQSPI